MAGADGQQSAFLVTEQNVGSLHTLTTAFREGVSAEWLCQLLVLLSCAVSAVTLSERWRSCFPKLDQRRPHSARS